MNFFPILTVRLLRPTCWWVLKQIIGVYSKSGIVMSRLCPRLSSNYIELCEGTLSKKYHALNWNSNIRQEVMQVMRFVSSKEYVRSKRFLHSFWVYQIFLFFPHTSSLVFLFSSSLIFSSFTLSLSFAFIPHVITQSSHIQT